jgi:hypothetical protein
VKTTRRITVSLLVILCSGWLLLYADSRLQRRRAERLFADLKSFPFADANFADSRDFAERHGGRPLATESVGVPPACTVHDCTFRASIHFPFFTLPPEGRPAELAYYALVFAGLRPWSAEASFHIVDDRWDETWADVGQAKVNADGGGSEVLTEIIYDVVARPKGHPVDPNSEPCSYGVFRPHVTGGPAEVLEVWATVCPDTPLYHAFDVDFRCVTSVLHGCRDFGELAPSSWAEYQHH